MGDIVGPEAALLVANFARGVSSELHSVKQKITSGEKHLAPVELDRNGLIAGLTGAAVPQDIAQQAIPEGYLDPNMGEQAIIEHEQRRMQQPLQPVYQQRPQAPYSTSVVPNSATDAMLNTIMTSLVSIERQLALLHKAIKQPKQPRTKKVQ